MGFPHHRSNAGRGCQTAFTYNYPQQARVIPALRAYLDGDAARRRAEHDRGQADDERGHAKGGYPSIPWTASYEWKVVTDLPRFLSLSEEASEYTGGAHPNGGFATLVWDRRAGRRIDPQGFFTSPAALSAAVRTPFCARLDAERRAKRAGGGGTYLPEFTVCPDAAQAGTVILGSLTRVRFDRIGFLIAPYAVGPYAEGNYEITVPVTPAVLAAVRPEWRPYFAVGPASTGAP